MAAGLLAITAGLLRQTEPPAPAATPSPTITRSPSPAGALWPAVPTPAPAADPAFSITGEERFGVAVPAGRLAEAAAAGLRYGSVLDWHISAAAPPGYWQMLRLSEEGIRQSRAEIERTARARPGSFWLVGNEPDVVEQDNVTPERYAELFHEAYHWIKGVDPTARIAIAGVTQPSTLRLAYLDRVLDAYAARTGRPLPVDLWNVHAFILREERGSWGAGIPPGLEAARGRLIEIDDHDDLALFRRQLIDFRIWLAERGYQDRPLVVSEYGILMPSEYGFDAERVARFLEGTLEFMTTARHEAGYPADDFRLVQWWFWYGVYDTPAGFPAGNLYDPVSRRLTPAGERFSRYPRP